MLTTETGIIIEGARELRYAQIGTYILGEAQTDDYLAQVEAQVIKDIYIGALGTVTPEEIEIMRNTSYALGERSPRDEDLIADVASGKVIRARCSARFPVEEPHARVVVDGLHTLLKMNCLERTFRGARKKVVESMLGNSEVII